MADDAEDEGPATPRVSGSYAVFRDEAHRVARLLDEAALIRSKRIDLYDADQIREARHMAAELREMGRRFQRWPSLGAEAVAKERAELVPELKLLMRRALAALEALPDAGALGKVRRPPRR